MALTLRKLTLAQHERAGQPAVCSVSRRMPTSWAARTDFIEKES
jgi:hypothetical protein